MYFVNVNLEQPVHDILVVAALHEHIVHLGRLQQHALAIISRGHIPLLLASSLLLSTIHLLLQEFSSKTDCQFPLVGLLSHPAVSASVTTLHTISDLHFAMLRVISLKIVEGFDCPSQQHRLSGFSLAQINELYSPSFRLFAAVLKVPCVLRIWRIVSFLW